MKWKNKLESSEEVGTVAELGSSIRSTSSEKLWPLHRREGQDKHFHKKPLWISFLTFKGSLNLLLILVFAQI